MRIVRFMLPVCALLFLTHVHTTDATTDLATVTGLLSKVTRVLPHLNDGLAARATQVVTFNVGNIIILALGKTLISMIVYAMAPTEPNGTLFKRSGEFRMVEPGIFDVDDTELQWGLEYLRADMSKNWSCMKRLMCEEPDRAETYMNIGRFMLNMVNWSKQLGLTKFTTGRHERIIDDLETAAYFGKRNATSPVECARRYNCASLD